MAACMIALRASGELAERKTMDSKAAPSPAQPGMLARSSRINFMTTGCDTHV